MIPKEYKKHLLLVAIGFALGLLATVFNHYIQQYLKPVSEVVFLSYEEDYATKPYNLLIIGNLGKASAHNINVFLGLFSIIPPGELKVDVRSKFKIHQVSIETRVHPSDYMNPKYEVQKSVKNVLIDELKPGQVAFLEYVEIYSSVSLAAYNQFPAWQVVHKDGYGVNIYNDKRKISTLFDYGESQFPLIVQRLSELIEKMQFRVNTIATDKTKMPPK